MSYFVILELFCDEVGKVNIQEVKNFCEFNEFQIFQIYIASKDRKELGTLLTHLEFSNFCEVALAKFSDVFLKDCWFKSR